MKIGEFLILSVVRPETPQFIGDLDPLENR